MLAASPFVVSLNRNSPLTANASSVAFDATFSKAVTGVDTTDFSVIKTGSIASTHTQVVDSGDHLNYTVTVSGITGDGTLGLDLVDNGSIKDSAGQGLVNPNSFAAFSLHSLVNTAGAPRSVASGDFNGDGKPDLAVANGNALSIYLGNGNGTFSSPSAIATGTQAASVTIGDVNSDGKLDLLIANTGSNTVTELLGNGNGTFQTAQNFATGTGTSPQQVVIGDLDADGKPDLAVANLDTNTVGVMWGNGNGTFQAVQTIVAGTNPDSVAIGDWDGNGKLDLVVANFASGNVTVLSGNGARAFPTQQSFATGSGAQWVTTADLDADDKLDLVVTNAVSNTVSILLGNGNGTVKSQLSYATGGSPRVVTIADVNGDGKLDLAVANANSNNFGILLGVGDGTFLGQQPFSTGTGPTSIVVGDFNSDGKPDVAVSNFNSNNFTVQLNTLRGNFTGQVYTLDHTAPFVQSINRTTPAAASTTGTTVTFTATFSKGVTGVDVADFGLITSGTVYTSQTVVTAVSSSVYTITVSGITGDGTLGLNLIDNGSIRDLSGNPLTQINASVTFSAQATIATGTGPRSIAVGDVNNDGKVDLVTANLSANTVTVALGNGNGTFQTPQSFATSANPSVVSLGDLNGDGKLDIAVANAASIGVLLGNGNGSFQTQQTFSTGGVPNAVAIGDVSGDGKMDIVAANYDNGKVSILVGNGSGGFATHVDYTTGSRPASVVLADINGDGKLDIATGHDTSNTVNILLGTGGGAFQAQQAYVAGNRPSTLTVGDVNGDGKLDLVTSNYGDNTVSVLLGTGSAGTFGAQQTFATGGSPRSVKLSDINGDSKLDLIVANVFGNNVSVLLGTGTGSFQTQQTSATSVNPFALAIADANGDGRPDVLAANFHTNDVSVLLNGVNGNFTGQIYTLLDHTGPEFTSSSMFTSRENGSVSVVVNAVDAHGPVNYAITGGADGAAFSLAAFPPTSTTLRLSPSPPLSSIPDYENPIDANGDNVFEVQITATDSLGNSTVQNVSIEITNENEAPTGLTLSGTTIAENQPSGTIVGQFATIDPDSVKTPQTFTYSLLGGAGFDTTAFEIDASGNLKTTRSFDYEAPPNTYLLRVQTEDQGHTFFVTTFTINVTNINEAPTVQPQSFTIAENSPNGTILGTVIAADVDAGDTLTFRISADDVPGVFAISNAGVITVADANKLDFETHPTIHLTVTATDSGLLANSNTITINLTDANEAPTAVTLENVIATLPENTNTASAIKIATIVVTDDALGTNTLYLTGGDAPFFQIVGNELFIKSGTLLNFENQAILSVTVNVDDTTVGATPDATAISVLVLTDVNEAPTAVTLQNMVSSIVEGNGILVPVKLADIVVTDDALGTNLLTVHGPDAAFFSIVGTQLFLKAGTDLNFAVKPQYDISIEADDTSVGTTPDASVNYSLIVAQGPVRRLVSGTNWNDTNGNGYRVNGELGLSGWTVYADLNNNGTADVGEPTTTTAQDDPGTTQDETGQYSLSLSAGTYAIRRLERSGFAPSSPTLLPGVLPESFAESVQTVTITTQNISGVNFGNFAMRNVAFSANSQSVSEGAGVVTLTGVIDSPIGVDIAVPVSIMVGGTAKYNVDYRVLDGSLFFQANSTQGTLHLEIIDDDRFEANETLTLALQPTFGVTLGTITSETITIADNDAAPTVAFLSNGQTGVEGQTIEVGVKLSGETDLDVTVPLVFTGSTATGPGALSDFSVSGGNTITIPAGSRTATKKFFITDDSKGESAETIRVAFGTLTNAVASSLPGDPLVHVITIPLNDQPSVSFTQSVVTKGEGDGIVNVTMNLSNTSALPVTIPFTIGGTAGASDRRFSIAGGISPSPTSTSGSVTFAPGTTSVTIQIHILDDTANPVAEPQETVVFTMGTVTNAVAGAVRTYTLNINDNDTPLVQFSGPNPTSVFEDTGYVYFTVTTSIPSTQSIVIPLVISKYNTAKTTGYARSGTDFTAIASSITIPAYYLSATGSIAITNDTVNEPDEIISLDMGSPKNTDGTASIARLAPVTKTTPSPTTQKITIHDNDPLLSIARTADTPSTITEGATRKIASFAVTLDHATNQEVKIQFSLSGSATLNSDYKIRSATGYSTVGGKYFVKIAAGQTEADINFDIIDDSLDENAESFSVALNSATGGATINTANGSANLKIIDNDSAPSVSFLTKDFSVYESYTKLLAITVGLSSVSGKDVYVKPGFASEGNGAKNIFDYRVSGLGGHGYVLIPAGHTSASFYVEMVDDKKYTGNRAFRITFTDKVEIGATLTRGSSVLVTIKDDEGPPIPIPAVQPPFYSNQLIFDFATAVGSYSASSSSTATTVLLESLGQVIAGTQIGGLGSSGFLDGTTVFFDSNLNGVRDFLDLNSDGIQDDGEPSEPSTITKSDGTFSLLVPSEFDTDGSGFFEPNEGRWVLAGGTDTSTGLAWTSRMYAALGDYVVTPLSSLVSSLVQTQAYAVPDAEFRVMDAFGLQRVDFSTYNSLAGLQAGDLTAGRYWITNIAVYSTVVEIANLFAGASGNLPVDYFSDLIYADIAARIADPDSSADVVSSAVVADIINGISTVTGIQFLDSVANAAADMITASNQILVNLNAGDYSDPESFANAIVKVKKVAQGDGAAALYSVGASTIVGSSQGETAAGEAQLQFTGSSLQARINAAVVGNIFPTKVAISDAQVREGDSGTRLLEFQVVLSGNHSDTVQVDFATGDNTTTAGSDYVATTGTLTWLPGDTSARTIQVFVNSDTVFEEDELLHVTLTNRENAVVKKSLGYGFIVNDDAATFSTPQNPLSGSNSFVISDSESRASFTQNGQQIVDGLYFDPLTVNVHGQDNVSDNLILDFSADTYRADTINYYGGGGTGTDSASIVGGSFETVTQKLINATDGQTILVPTGSDNNVVFNWFGLEPFTLGGATNNLIFELPAGVTNVVLEDADPTDATNSGMMRLRSTRGDFETTVFRNPNATLTIRGGNGADSITIASLDPTFIGTLIIEGQSLGNSGTSLTVTDTSMAGGLTLFDTDFTVNGIVSLAGPLILNTGTTVRLDLTGTTPGTDFDQMIASDIVAGGATLMLILAGSFTPTKGSSFEILRNTSINPTASTFQGLPNDTLITLSGRSQFRIDYNGGTNRNDIVVTATNNQPTAIDDAFLTDEDVPLELSQADIKGNDTDVDTSNDGLTVIAVAGAHHGTAVLNADGTITFNPEANYNGLAGFDYTLSDGSLSDLGHVAIIVTAVNDIPVASITEISATRFEGMQISIASIATDADGIHDTLTYSYAVYKNGSTTAFASGSGVDLTGFSFTPDDNGSYEIVLTVNDLSGAVATARQTISVDNVAPVLDTLLATSVLENGTVHLTGNYHDVGTQDTHTLTIAWGEGVPQTVVVTGGTFDITYQYLDDTPPGTTSDDFVINVILTDDDLGTDTGSAMTTITNVAPTATLSSTGGIVYGQIETVTFTSQHDVSTADINAGFRYAYSLTGDFSGISYTNGATTNASFNFAGLNAGSYTCYARIIDKDNGYSEYTAPFTIQRATATILVTPYNVIYDSFSHTAVGSALGVLGETLAGLNLSGTTHTNAGNYSDIARFTDVTGNYNNVATIAVSNSIAKASAVITVTPYSVTYDSFSHTATGSALGVQCESLAGLDLSQTTHTNAGNYSDIASFTDVTGNYNNVATIAVNNSIAKANATLIVSGYTGTFNAAAHGATGLVTGVAGDLAAAGGSLNLGASFTNAPGGTAVWTFSGGTNYNNQNGTATITINKANAVVTVNGFTGTYDAAAHGATGSVTGVAGDLAAAGSSLNLGASFTNALGGTAVWTFSGGTNYSNQSGTTAISIAKANAVVTVNGYTGTYNATARGATGSVTGVAGDLAAAGGSLNLGASFTNAPGGTANWSFTGGTNYNDQSGTVDIVINKANATVTVNGYSGTYDTSAHGATGTVVGVAGDLAASGSSLSLGSSFTNAPGGTASWSFTGGTNYNDRSGTAAIVINRAAVTITANSKSKTYGDVNPALDAAITGTVNGDVLAYSLSTPATQFSNVASYGIVVTLGTNPNYNVTPNNGTLTIGQKSATVSANSKSKTYGAVNPTLDATVTGTVNGDVLNYSLDTSAGQYSNVGQYGISVTLGTNGNYNVTPTGGTLSISKANATLIVNGYSGIYDAFSHGASGSVVGVAADATAAGSSLKLGASFTNAPGGTANWVFTGGTNYNDQSGSAAIAISRRAVTVKANDQSKVYGSVDPALTYGITSGSLVAIDAFFGSLARDAGENAGSYAITRGTLGLSDNYDLSFVQASLTILRATLTGDATTQDALNMAKQGKLNITVSNISGFKNGENAGVFLSSATFWITIGNQKYVFVPTTTTKLSNSSIAISYILKDSALQASLADALSAATSASTAIKAGFSMDSTNYSLSDDYLTRLFSTLK